MSSILFTPLKVGRLSFVNRICVPPMCQFRAVDGIAQPWHKVHYGKLAGSGAGAVVFEATAVAPEGRITPWCLGLWNDAQEAALHDLVVDCQSISPETRLFVQLSHAGRKGGQYQPWHEPGIVPVSEGGYGLVSCSALRYDAFHAQPQEMTPAQIEASIRAFAAAAVRAARAGFDGVQIHAAHGYLIHQFLSPVSNHRQDAWGGSLENRMRYALAVIRAIAQAAPGLEIMLRVSATDWIEGGWDEASTIELVRRAAELGCSAVDVSAGGLDCRQQLPAIGPGYQVGYASAVKKATGLTTFAVGLIKEPLQAEAIIESGQADAVCIGREMLRNPHWGWMAAQALHAMVAFPPPYLRAF